MLKSCKYCGRIHDTKFNCGQKPQGRHKADSEAHQIHQKNRWKELSKEIRDRDGYCCVVCMSGNYNAIRHINYEGVSVHHIEPLSERPDLAYDRTNLITLCSYHHERAEAGEISRDELHRMAARAEDKDAPGV